jgi:hypothetical protein
VTAVDDTRPTGGAGPVGPAELLRAGLASDRAHTRRLAERITADLSRLAAKVAGEQKVRDLEEQLAAARSALNAPDGTPPAGPPAGPPTPESSWVGS